MAKGINPSEKFYNPKSMRFFIVESIQNYTTGELDYVTILELGTRERILLDGLDLMEQIETGALVAWQPAQTIDKRVKKAFA